MDSEDEQSQFMVSGREVRRRQQAQLHTVEDEAQAFEYAQVSSSNRIKANYMKSIHAAKLAADKDFEIRKSIDFDSKAAINKRPKVGFPSMLDSGIAGLQLP